ncbi:MAG: type II CRISPR RNA-guided endonuclease Cas9 [Lactobacillaceae bacterium]|jgi:CRISPR-associated endonuclease Csn1|nr:type II CRISPR RNA-guided endonuclease Cas9 [Lactobacillaceae bacterium]
MKKRIFGFDLGIASIGWAVVDFDKEKFDSETGEIIEGRIVKSGVRTFPVAENPKNGESLAKPRRDSRLGRRTIRRKARRMDGIKGLFVVKGLAPSKEYLKDVYAKQIGGDVWDLRVKALSSMLEKDELLRVLKHLAKHRGFKSYRKAAEEADKEGGKVLKAIKANKELLSEDKTLAQIIVERAGTGKKRNSTATNAKGKIEAVYNNSIPRDEIIREAEKIFEVQKPYGLFTEDLLNDYKRIAFRHRAVGGVGDMVGFCTFETGEKRAPKEAPSAEIFVALGKINNLKVNGRFLTSEERTKALDILKNTKEVKYTSLKKAFNEDVKFDDINYNKKDKVNKKTGEITKTKPEDAKFYAMKGWHKLRDELGEDIKNIDVKILDKAINIIACEKNDAAIEQGLKELSLKDEHIKKLKKITSDKFINLSLKALYNINPHLETGLKYNEACEKAGYDFKKSGEALVEKGFILAPIPQDKLTAVPVVNRTTAQFRKVYNAIVREYGYPDQINLEVSRELKKSFDDRQKDIKKRDDNTDERSSAIEELQTEGLDTNGKNILKWRLYQQQNGKCIYSEKSLDLRRLDEYEVDHILPYSRSLDNSFNNKVLCLAEENQKKRNRTPFEYLPKDKWEEFKTVVSTTPSLGRRKKENLLNESFSKEEDELKFRERNSNDNAYISRFVKQYLEDGVDFSKSVWKDIKNRIQVRTGSLTDYLRGQWHLEKDRDKDDRHHAQDAIVVACATQEMVKYLSTVSGLFEDKYQLGQKNGEAWYKSLKQKFREPWIGFREEVSKSLDNIFVSRPPRKSATGEIHQETVRSLNPKHKKYSEKDVKSGLKVRGGLANNGNMLRTDVFVKKNKKGKDEFYLVPIYLSSMGKELPNKAIVAGKEEAEWLDMDETFAFKFSLYKDDLVKVKKGDNEIFGYFDGTHRGTGAITIEKHDRSDLTSIGAKTQDIIKKYQVDMLGNYHEIKKEVRLPLKKEK